MPTSESSKSPTAALVCVGSELLRGKLNLHASTLAGRLASVGIELAEEHTVADDRSDLGRVLVDCLNRRDLVLVTGGLGPTFDDLSREAASDAVGRPLRRSSALLKDITRKFRRAKYTMPPANARQADLLEGAVAFRNERGTAPGQWLDLSTGLHPRVLSLLPGPPSELHPMLEKELLPRLRKRFSSRGRAEAHLHFVGVPESIVDQKLGSLIRKTEVRLKGKVQFTILAHLGLVDFDIFVSAGTKSKAQNAVEHFVRDAKRRMGKAFYGQDRDYPLEKVVMNRFVRQRATLAVAESCTGGMLGSTLTSVPGSSDYFKGGVVAYSDAAKRELLGVPAETLKRFGAVSEPTARAMAEGVRRQLGTTCGLSITGIAGPGGGTPKKPTGLVFLGLASARRTLVRSFAFRGTRDAVRQRAVIGALDLLRAI